MIPSARWAGIASLAMLVAAPCLAAVSKPDSASVPLPSGARAGRGAVGGLIGGSLFDGSGDYSKGAQARFDFSGHYRYVMGPRWRWQVSPGFTWSGYSKNQPPPFVDAAFPTDATKEHYLTLMIPVSAQLQVTWGRKLRYYLGAGPGIYRVWVENHRQVLRDPSSLRLHRGPYWGFTIEAGAEKFLKALPNTSVELSLAQHQAFAKRDDQFPAGFNGSVSALALRAGVNYYFDLKKPKKATDLPVRGTPKKK